MNVKAWTLFSFSVLLGELAKGMFVRMKVEELVNKHFHTLSANDLNIWKYISTHKEDVSKATLEEVSQKSNSSKSSIHRFSQKISFKGFSELKYALKNEVTMEDLDTNIIENYILTITKSMNDMKNRDFTSIIKLMGESKKVFLYGTGTLQRAVAQEMRRVFLSGNKHFYVVEGVDEIESLTETLSPEDMVFIISLKGESDNAYSFSRSLKSRGVPFVTITSFSENKLSQLSDESILINLEGSVAKF